MLVRGPRTGDDQVEGNSCKTDVRTMSAWPIHASYLVVQFLDKCSNTASAKPISQHGDLWLVVTR